MVLLWMWIARHTQSTQNKFIISLQYLKENVQDEVDFLPTDKHQRFPQIYTIVFGVCVAKHVQITQDNKFAIFLQYLKKEVSNEVDFLHADKDESLHTN